MSPSVQLQPIGWQQRWAAPLLVLLLHGLLLMGLQIGLHRDASHEPARRVFMGLRLPHWIEAGDQARVRAIKAAPRSAPLPSASPRLTPPEPNAAPAPDPTNMTFAQPAPAAAFTAPLRLSLPADMAASQGRPGTAAEAASRDSRANSARRTVESRIADVVGTDAIVETRLGDGHLINSYRGNCTELRELRIQQLDPFNKSIAPLPALARTERCKE